MHEAWRRAGGSNAQQLDYGLDRIDQSHSAIQAVRLRVSKARQHGLALIQPDLLAELVALVRELRDQSEQVISQLD
jgi:hypothetical protein